MNRSVQGQGRVGFTLVETIVALAVIAVALLFTLALVAQEPRATRRVAAHGEALRALEATLESFRAGTAVPVDNTVIEPEAWLRPPEPTAEGLRIVVTVTPESPPGLAHVVLQARYDVRGARFERTLETLLWSPP